MPTSSEAFVALGGNPRTAAPTLVIGEVAQAHDGSLGLAHAFIDAIADAGGDAVKFQTHVADAESTAEEPLAHASSASRTATAVPTGGGWNSPSLSGSA